MCFYTFFQRLQIRLHRFQYEVHRSLDGVATIQCLVALEASIFEILIAGRATATELKVATVRAAFFHTELDVAGQTPERLGVCDIHQTIPFESAQEEVSVSRVGDSEEFGGVSGKPSLPVHCDDSKGPDLLVEEGERSNIFLSAEADSLECEVEFAEMEAFAILELEFEDASVETTDPRLRILRSQGRSCMPGFDFFNIESDVGHTFTEKELYNFIGAIE